MGFTAVQLLPVSQYSDLWGYSPMQPMVVHNAYGTPDEMRAFVDAAHTLGLAVIIDVVLHHGAPNVRMCLCVHFRTVDGRGVRG